MSKSILIIGGARSGKSRYAQELARKSGLPVLFVATATAGDEEMRLRIEQHQKERPADWRTIEAVSHIGSSIAKHLGESRIILIDDITLLIGNIFFKYTDAEFEQVQEMQLEQAMLDEINELTGCIEKTVAAFILISNEVGQGIVPENRMGRIYRDILGKANQLLAQHADEVYLMAAGIPLKLK